MLIYSIRRLIQTIPVVIGVTIVVFLLMHLIPGDAAQVIIGEGAPKEQVERIRENLGLNDPRRFSIGTTSAACAGDLGDSIRARPIADEIFKSRFWITVELAVYSTILAVFLGILAGIISAVKKLACRYWRHVHRPVRTVDAKFLAGAHADPIFCRGFGLVPSLRLGHVVANRPARDYARDRRRRARMTRSSMLEVIGQDYIRTAQAKGVRERSLSTGMP